VHLDNCVKQLVNFLKHFCAHNFVLFDFLVSVGQLQCARMAENHLDSTQKRPHSIHNGFQERSFQASGNHLHSGHSGIQTGFDVVETNLCNSKVDGHLCDWTLTPSVVPPLIRGLLGELSAKG
jgi:hypothetical protein